MIQENKNNLKIATFGMGCFWHVQEVFSKINGVKETMVGFMGGKVEKPSYERVCGGDTEHAEVVQLKYDPEIVSYEELLSVFWEKHDPTTMNRQGPDIGSQYRSVIFYHTPEQEKLAKESKEQLEKINIYGSPIVTQILPAIPFYKAEEHHQNYLQKGGKNLK